ncbi:hypothetical protein PO909_027028 [Leuciscus waleckii]
MILALVLLRFWLLWHLGGRFGVETGEMKTLSVMEGDSVTLHADVSDIQGDITVIEWMFGAENTDTVIAEINRAANINTVYERFRDRGQMDIQTGSLTITNIRTTDSGLYKLDITSTNTVVVKTFRVTVYAFLPVPVIIRNTSQSSSSSESSSVSKCVLQCSVVNVSHVTLSWYRGLSLLSSISVCDLSISLSLPLEVEYQDKNTYSCVINNPIRNQTKHLDITKLCQSVVPHTEKASWQIVTLIFGLVSVVLFIGVIGLVKGFAEESNKHPQRPQDTDLQQLQVMDLEQPQNSTQTLIHYIKV